MRLVVEVPFYNRVLDVALALRRKQHEFLPGAALLESVRSSDSLA